TRLLFLDPSVTLSGTGLRLSVKRNSTPFARYLSTSNQQAVASALDPLSSSPPAALGAVYDDLLNSNAQAFPGQIDQLSGEAYASLESSLFSQSTQWTQSVADRLYQTRHTDNPGARQP